MRKGFQPTQIFSTLHNSFWLISSLTRHPLTSFSVEQMFQRSQTQERRTFLWRVLVIRIWLLLSYISLLSNFAENVLNCKSWLFECFEKMHRAIATQKVVHNRILCVWAFPIWKLNFYLALFLCVHVGMANIFIIRCFRRCNSWLSYSTWKT